MLTHHVATIFLILMSYVALYDKFGALIFVLHDFVDIFLYWAKTTRNADWKLLTHIFFACFSISFLILRLILFPILIYTAIFGPCPNENTFFFKESNNIFEMNYYGVCFYGYCYSLYRVSIGLLTLLLMLHCFWFYRILLIFYSIFKGGMVEDDPRYKEE